MSYTIVVMWYCPRFPTDGPSCLGYVLIYDDRLHKRPVEHYLISIILQVEGVQGIMAAYASALNQVALSGPTLFGPVINKAAEIAGQSLSCNSRKYFVLLIITVKRRMTYSCVYFYFVFLPCRENLTSKLHISLHSFFPFYGYYYVLGGLK